MAGDIVSRDEILASALAALLETTEGRALPANPYPPLHAAHDEWDRLVAAGQVRGICGEDEAEAEVTEAMEALEGGRA